LVLPVGLFGGCLAMNIPSVRYQDPEDRGGILGAHKKQEPATLEAMAESQHSSIDSTSCGCIDCGEGEMIDGEKPEKPPEVPWPRFHPLPTRPVFSLPK